MLIKKERIPVLQLLLVGFLPSAVKKFYYRLRGYKIGKNVRLSLGSVIIGKEVEIGDHVKVGFLTMLRGRKITIQRHVKIGSLSVIDTEKIFIDEDARINEQVYIGGMKTPESSLHLGKRTIVMQLSYINPTLPVYIGDDSGIGGHCLLFTHGSWNNQLEGFPVKFAAITIGKKVWLPWRVFVMPGTTIGDQVVIGANSLLQGEIPSHSLAAGNPAKILKSNYPEIPTEEKKAAILQNIYSEFEKHLQYHFFSIEKSTDNGCEVWQIRNTEKNAMLCISGGAIPEIKNIRPDNVLIVRELNTEQIRNAKQSGWKMLLLIDSAQRYGSTDCGEEITAFFSRYGIRFSRMDE